MKKNTIWYVLGGGAVLVLGYWLYSRSQPPTYVAPAVFQTPQISPPSVPAPSAPADPMRAIQTRIQSVVGTSASTTPMVAVTMRAASYSLPRPR